MRSRLVFTEIYNKRAAKWLRRHPGLRGQYAKTLELMELNIHHPSLRLHKLSGRLSGLSSVSINMSYRITIEMIISDGDIILVDVGAHEGASHDFSAARIP